MAGASPSGKIGEIETSHGHLIKNLAIQSLKKNPNIKIFGNDYKTKDGTCIRDYVHVCDLVDAHVLGLKCLQSGRGGRAFNLGTGDGFSVRQVIDQAKHVTNRSVPITEGARRPEDCTKLVSGSRRAETELGWSADRSNLSQMITDAWSWHQTGDCQNCSKVLLGK
mgnify:CR=1 FL=1